MRSDSTKLDQLAFTHYIRTTGQWNMETSSDDQNKNICFQTQQGKKLYRPFRTRWQPNTEYTLQHSPDPQERRDYIFQITRENRRFRYKFEVFELSFENRGYNRSYHTTKCIFWCTFYKFPLAISAIPFQGASHRREIAIRQRAFLDAGEYTVNWDGERIHHRAPGGVEQIRRHLAELHEQLRQHPRPLPGMVKWKLTERESWEDYTWQHAYGWRPDTPRPVGQPEPRNLPNYTNPSRMDVTDFSSQDETNSEEERKKAITYKSWTPPELDSDDYGFEG